MNQYQVKSKRKQLSNLVLRIDAVFQEQRPMRPKMIGSGLALQVPGGVPRLVMSAGRGSILLEPLDSVTFPLRYAPRKGL